ncbi:hypothetical protein PPS11_26219 [Pseudomonas putida S11]|nr:hypothetical protein PPS11_26219 [Pseudomonas putida S11]
MLSRVGQHLLETQGVEHDLGSHCPTQLHLQLQAFATGQLLEQLHHPPDQLAHAYPLWRKLQMARFVCGWMSSMSPISSF